MLHLGLYHLARQRIGYRNDYCLSCAAPRLSVCLRSFDVLHLWFVPILPLGYWKRWRCATCESNPHARITTRRSLRWAGTAVLAFIALAGWMTLLEPTGNRTWFDWALRVGSTVGVVFALRAALYPPPEPNLAGLLAAVPPNLDPHCPLCRAPVVAALPRWRCTGCRAERFVLVRR